MLFLVVLALAAIPGPVAAQEPPPEPAPEPAPAAQPPLPEQVLPVPEASPPDGRPSNDPYGTAHLQVPAPAPAPARGPALDTERPPAPPLDAAPPPDDMANVPLAIVGGVVGYGIGLLSAYLIIAATIESDEDLLVLGGPLAVFTAGLCIAGGVDIGGDANGSDGSFWAAFGGQALGGLASLLVILATVDDRDSEWIGIAAFFTLPIVGGVAGYEMSDDHPAAP